MSANTTYARLDADDEIHCTPLPAVQLADAPTATAPSTPAPAASDCNSGCPVKEK